tara:strand:- start:39 stop:566 length:528 start_codon:yes stop_codon:yes gene_type:complete
MSFKTITTSSLAIGALALTLAPADAHAQSFVKDIFGDKGACDEGFVVLPGVAGGGRDCSEALDVVQEEASKDRRHDRNSQLIGLGGNLVTSLILNSQNQKAEESAGPSAAELALIQQQHELELLKLQLQLQAQQARPVYGAPATVNYVPGYPQPPVANPASYGPYPYPAQPAQTF